MTREVWSAVDKYISHFFAPPDPALEAALKASDENGLDPINVSPVQGKFLYLLAKIQRAEKILEIGTLGGYSTIWLARALPPNGSLLTLEANPKHADVARANIGHAGLADTVEIHVGRAQETLPKLVEGRRGPFDLIFIDADKPSYAEYFKWAMELSRRGTLIIADNVVRNGAVADAHTTDANALGIRKFFEAVAAEKRVDTTVLQMVGSKGYDGLSIALVTGDQ